MPPFKKTFGALRRKSTGNVLDGQGPSISPTTPESAQPNSFRVITREDMEARKFSGRHVINLDEKRDPRLRGSHASSALTRVGADTAASSVRYSSASTVPSSFEIDDSFPPPRVTNMNGSASRRSPHGSPEPRGEESHPRIYHSSHLSRERAMTTSSYASTAVAPKLETPIPISDTSLESDFGNMFSGLGVGDRKSNNVTPQPLTQPPPRAFVRADSEPQIPSRKPVGGMRSDFSSLPSPVRVDTSLSVESPALSPGLRSQKSTDRLMYSSASGASSPGSPPPVPPHHEKPAAIRKEQSRQTSYNSSSETGTAPAPAPAPANSNGSRSQPSVQRAAARHDQGNSTRDPPNNAVSHSRLGSADSFNTSALAYPQSSQNEGPRKMTQKDFEAAKQQEQYEEKVRMRRGDTLDDDDIAEYDDMDDEEELRKAAKRRERQQALLSVHRQSVAKSVGREASGAFSSDMNNLFDSTTAGANPSLNYRSSSTPEVILKKDSHMLQYAHHTPDIKPPQLSDYIRPAADQRTRSFSGMRLPSGSSESDEDIPLGQILLTKNLTKNPEEMRRLSTAGSLARGSASIMPSLHGMSVPNLPRPPSRQSQISRPSSRASKSLPPFARNAPHPDDLPLMPGFQQGSYFQMTAPPPIPPQYAAAAATPQPQFTYQNSFGGQYTAQPGTPGAPTLMDGLQQEEKMKKWRHQNTNQGRTMTLPNMAPPQMFNPQMGMGGMGGMGYMGMPQQQQMGMGMGMMGMGMGMGMGMPMMPQQMPPPQMPPQISPQQMAAMGMNMGMMNMNMNMMNGGMAGMGAGMNMTQNPNARFQSPAGQAQRMQNRGPLAAASQTLQAPAQMSGLPGGYAPSIAPSERSNIGIPNRYRPITTANDGASVVGGAEPVEMAGMGGAVGAPDGPDKKRKGVKAWLGKRMGGMDGVGEDEYDAEGEGEEWGNMRKSRVLRAQKM